MGATAHDAIRRRILYCGHVQGVGFRYTAARTAGDYAVTGYVRNLPAGQVELVVEGAPAEVDRFAAALADRMAGYIRQADAADAPATGEFRQFEVRF